MFTLNTFAQDFDYMSPEGHTRVVESVSFSPDGRMLASGSVDRTIHLWMLPRVGHCVSDYICRYALPEDVSSRFTLAIGKRNANLQGCEIDAFYVYTDLRRIVLHHRRRDPLGRF